MFIRNCPKCNREIKYSSKIAFNAGKKRNGLCKSCNSKGSKNPFYGKKHTKESTKKRIENTDYSFTQTKEYKNKMSSSLSGDKNPMFGKNNYDIWIKKYGKKEADIRQENFKNKQSILNSGKNNNMYGKPSPQGSGNGWSGWYNNWHFRSLLELSYMINVIERFNLNWENGESIKIKYVDWEGKTRNYFPDFLIEEKYLVEIKPKYLHTSKNSINKKKGAEKYCIENSLKYKIRDTKRVSKEEFLKLYTEKKIELTEYYNKKLIKWLNEL